MKRYVITVCNPKKIRDELTMYEASVTGRPIAVYSAETYQQELDWQDDDKGMSVYYTSEYSYAEKMAEELARSNPGKEVYVSKIEAIVFAPPAEVKLSKVTEKGVVPA